MLQYILEYIAKKHTVTMVITSENGKDTNINNVKIEYRPATSIIKDNFDILITQFQEANTVIPIAQFRRKPSVFIIHNDMYTTEHTLKIVTKGDLVIANTKWLTQWAENRTRASVITVHPYTDLKLYAKKHKCLKQFITIVNPTASKGGKLFRRLAETNPKRMFMAVQGGYYEQYQLDYSDLPNVTKVAQTDYMAGIYAKSRIVLQMSDYESWGMVAREAMASGTPVICTPTIGLLENVGRDYPYLADFDYLELVQRHITTLDNKQKYAETVEDVKKRSKSVDYAKEMKHMIERVEAL